MDKQGILMETGVMEADGTSAASRVRTWRGWPHILVQGVFCVITVTSFLLIISSTVSKSAWVRPGRCLATACHVTCSYAPHFGQYERDIIDAVKDQDQICRGVQLTLNNPMFPNGTIPKNWLGNVPYRIKKLAIVGGNPTFITPEAFMSEFTKNIYSLSLEDVKISQWDRDTLLGLMKLNELTITDSSIDFVDKYALRPVRATLREISIRSSGHWNPVNFTGSSVLLNTKVVNFSFNNFSDIITAATFSQLRYCVQLNLASSKITAIEAGAFNHLTRIKLIELNNNLLKTLPMGLFSGIATTAEPLLVDLHDNLWHCSCDINELRVLSINKRLVNDPVCTAPDKFEGDSLSSLGAMCNDSTGTLSPAKSVSPRIEDDENYIISDTDCNSKYVRLVAPLLGHDCYQQLKNSESTLRYVLSYSGIAYINTTLQELLKPNFYVRNSESSVLELTPTASVNTGFFWFVSSCPDTVYCVDAAPSFLRIYNADLNKEYTLCQMGFDDFASLSCMKFTPSYSYVVTIQNNIGPLYITVGMVTACLFGAIIVYVLIRRHPTLMKGSKRVLIVKQRIFDALVLPPSVAPRIPDEEKTDAYENRNMALLRNNKMFLTSKSGTNSIRSERSGSPSYISVMPPDELTMNRGPHTNELANISWIYDTSSPCYSVYSTVNSVHAEPL